MPASVETPIFFCVCLPHLQKICRGTYISSAFLYCTYDGGECPLVIRTCLQTQHRTAVNNCFVTLNPSPLSPCVHCVFLLVIHERLVNGEGDRLSGLVVDVFSGVVGVSSSAVWVEAFRPDIEAALEQEFGTDATEIVWRRSDGRLQQDGWKGNAAIALENGDASAPSPVDGGLDTNGVASTGALAGQDGAESTSEGEGGEMQGRRARDDVPTTVVRELGLEYEVRPQFGQKTGTYLLCETKRRLPTST